MLPSSSSCLSQHLPCNLTDMIASTRNDLDILTPLLSNRLQLISLLRDWFLKNPRPVEQRQLQAVQKIVDQSNLCMTNINDKVNNLNIAASQSVNPAIHENVAYIQTQANTIRAIAANIQYLANFIFSFTVPPSLQDAVNISKLARDLQQM